MFLSFRSRAFVFGLLVAVSAIRSLDTVPSRLRAKRDEGVDDNSIDSLNIHDPTDYSNQSRDTRPASTTTSTGATGDDCIAPSIQDFPTDLFTQRQRMYGALVFHLTFAVFLYMAITKVCDDYFMNALDLITQVS